MKRAISIVVLAFLVGCGGGGGKKDSTAATATVGANAVLALAPASLSATIDGKPMELSLDASGKVTMNGQLVATLTSAGEAKDANGKTIATMTSDGKVTIADEPSEDVAITADGVVQSKGEAIVSIGGDGILAGKLISDQDAKVAYKGAPESRRAMMLAWVVVATNRSDATPETK